MSFEKKLRKLGHSNPKKGSKAVSTLVESFEFSRIARDIGFFEDPEDVDLMRAEIYGDEEEEDEDEEEEE